MKSIYKKLIPLVLVSFTWLSFTSAGNSSDPVQQIKDILNDKTEAIHQADTAAEKRILLNETLDLFIVSSEAALEHPEATEEVKASVLNIKAHFAEKKAELNGTHGFDPVPDDELDTFATFVQQDTEQAANDFWGDTPLISMIALTLVLALLVALVLCFEFGVGNEQDCG